MWLRPPPCLLLPLRAPRGQRLRAARPREWGCHEGEPRPAVAVVLLLLLLLQAAVAVAVPQAPA